VTVNDERIPLLYWETKVIGTDFDAVGQDSLQLLHSSPLAAGKHALNAEAQKLKVHIHCRLPLCINRAAEQY
jgi:hypothetical protein